MNIDIRGHHIELTYTLCLYTERRLQEALHHFGTQVVAVTVTLEDLKGSRGKANKQCHMTVSLATIERLRVEAKAKEITLAVDYAVDRISHAIARELERCHRYASYRPSITRMAGSTLFQRQSRTTEQTNVF